MKASLRILAVAGASLSLPAWGQTPVPGPNVNMVSGTTWPNGDPFLQRQNEPSMAVSTRNPAHLLAGANDYRTVDLAIAIDQADPDAKVTGDGWLGLFTSMDGGQTWQSTLVPGCPYPVAQCQGSPATRLAFQAGSDPVVRAGANGMFFYSGLMFDRDHSRSAIVVSRFIDDNNRERIVDNTIRYLDAAIVVQGSASSFVDKPWIAVDIPRAGAGTCSIPASGNGPAQSFPAGNVYVAWAAFDANDASSQIFFSRSTNCGVTWSQPQQLSQGSGGNQGAAIAIDPSGNVYVTWRQAALSVLTVTANNVSRPYGSPNPAFTASYSGFENGDTLAKAVTGSPSFTTTATPTSAPGTYPITIMQGMLSAPEYVLNFVNGTLTVTPPTGVPPSGTTCNGFYGGTFNGNLTISAGQACTFVGGGVSGNITQTGGSLTLIGSNIGGNVIVENGGVFSFSSSTNILGNLTAQNIPAGSAQDLVCGVSIQGNVVFQSNGSAFELGAASGCAGNTIGGSVTIQSDSASTSVAGNTIKGNLVSQSNRAATQLTGNTVSGSLTVQSDTSTTQIATNGVSGNLVVQSDTGATQVSSNTVKGNLTCSGNTSITGSANKAAEKTGQCATF